jgi:hypothetical protein
MKTLALTVAVGALLVATQANAGNFPVNTMNGAESGLIEQVAVRVYVHEGHRYCFYAGGWHGAGWYRCGYAHRHGIGWGGEYGWNSWTYGPYERRHGERAHRGDRERIGVETRTNRTRTGVETQTNRTRTGSETRSRSTTTGTNVDGGARVRGSTTGAAPASDVQTRGGAKVQGGAAVRDSGGKGPSGGVGGGAAVEEKK